MDFSVENQQQKNTYWPFSISPKWRGGRSSKPKAWGVRFLHVVILLAAFSISSCQNPEQLSVTIYQTSAAGDKLAVQQPAEGDATATITLLPDQKFQTITGFGGSFTESSAFLLNQLSAPLRDSIMQAYFGKEGAQYSLCRTHINSSDFSLDHYSFAPVAGDTALENFSIDEDRSDILPMIKAAQAVSTEGFKLVASPWTAPPWMKDNNDWYGGKLLPKYYPTWALFFRKYAKAYQQEGVPIWAFTVENEPMGNDAHWESMHYTAEEMADFVTNHLGPQLQKDSVKSHILVYDQNRGKEMEEWANVLLTDKKLAPYIYGTAVHWYSGTEDWFPQSLQKVHSLAPQKHILHTEGCIDAEVPHWQDDAWYWKKEATDWGWDWAKPEDKHLHPKYVPAYRYARDIIGCLNNWVEGWIDWNMVLDEKGGPNLANNWCVAPIIVKPSTNEVYFTPLYYVLAHFSKFIRPGATRIGFTSTDPEIMTTAVKNTDGSFVVVLLNMGEKSKVINVQLGTKKVTVNIAKQALQTVVIAP